MSPSADKSASFRLTRFVILRLLGLVYFFAFLSLALQVLPLIGHDGLLPADMFLLRVADHFGSAFAGFRALPSVFWLYLSDSALLGLAWLGVLLSAVVAAGFANGVLMLFLWALYMSFVHIGQTWYGFGWEIELLETGFLAVFLCRPLSLSPFPARAPPRAVLVLYSWLAFRIMFGAGLIKIRGDACWRDLTCLYFHYETQPIPSPLSRLFHFAPKWFHQLGVLFNHFAELIAPFGVFGPWAALRRIAGGVLLLFQVILIASGNLSFLNWLTIVPCLACFDDALLARVLPRALVARSEAERDETPASRGERYTIRALLVLVALLSINPVVNMLSGQQRMNSSFDPLDLVNTYGAFGSVGKERHEIVLEGTRDHTLTATTTWRAYALPCQPGDPMRRPCLSGPYHRRLDWQIWFAAMSAPSDEPWMVHLVYKLLSGDPGVLRLLADNPFPEGPPHFIRAELYRYEMAPIGDLSGAWWRRSRSREWLPPLALEDLRLQEFLSNFGWLPVEFGDGAVTSTASGP